MTDTVGYRRALQDAAIGATWRATDHWTLDGRISAESGLRSTAGGDLSLAVGSMPFGFDGRAGLGVSESVWARSMRAHLGLTHALGAGRLSFDGTVVAYRWRRPGLSASTRWRWAPSLRFSRPLGRVASLLIMGSEILDDRLDARSQVGAWINYRIGS